jgi:hypothetical protein
MNFRMSDGLSAQALCKELASLEPFLKGLNGPLCLSQGASPAPFGLAFPKSQSLRLSLKPFSKA